MATLLQLTFGLERGNHLKNQRLLNEDLKRIQKHFYFQSESFQPCYHIKYCQTKERLACPIIYFYQP